MGGFFAAVCGVKNSGKTTLMEELIREMTARGLRTAVVKHDGHAFAADTPGTDSFRYVGAGACGAAVFSDSQVMIRRVGRFPHPVTGTSAREKNNTDIGAFLQDLCQAFPEADVILAEGLKELPVPKIEVVRSAVSQRPVSNPAGRFLVVSDLPEEKIGEETLSFAEVAGIADRILQRRGENPADAAGAGDRIPRGREKEICGQKKKEEKHTEEKDCEVREDRQGPEDFTHFDQKGGARMVNVGDKEISRRTAVAQGRVLVSPPTLALIRSGGMKKGDVLGTARIAGIMGAKRTSDLIPMCHPLFISGICLDLTLNEEDCAVDIRAEVSCEGKTGVEMEALTAVSTAALTVYDMCKAIQRDIEITGIRLVEKTGGVHGDYHRD